jgi:hypothetical protein
MLMDMDVMWPIYPRLTPLGFALPGQIFNRDYYRSSSFSLLAWQIRSRRPASFKSLKKELETCTSLTYVDFENLIFSLKNLRNHLLHSRVKEVVPLMKEK